MLRFFEDALFIVILMHINDFIDVNQ